MTSRLRLPPVILALSALATAVAAAPSARAQEPIPLPPPPETRMEIRSPWMIAGGSVLAAIGTIGMTTSLVILVSTYGSDVNYTGITAIGLAASAPFLGGGIALIVVGAQKRPVAPKEPPTTAKLLVSPSSVGVSVSF